MRDLPVFDALRRGAYSSDVDSFALSIFSRIHGGPPNLLNFSRCALVSRRVIGTVWLPAASAGRPGRFVVGVLFVAMGISVAAYFTFAMFFVAVYLSFQSSLLP